MKLSISLLALLSATFVSAQYGNAYRSLYYDLEAREADPFEELYDRSAMDFDDTIFEME